MNKSSKNRSDIEEILQSQTWKRKKLEPIRLAKKKTFNLKETEKNSGLVERNITQKSLTTPEPTLPSPISFSEELPDRIESKSPLMTLAVPFSILNKAISDVALKTHDLQIPVFPKRIFGKSVSFPSIPKFKSLKTLGGDKEIIDLKLENGRIRKTKMKTVRRRFEFLDDFQHIANEKMIQRMKSGLNHYE